MALDDLTRYESAAVAASNAEKDKQLAVSAMSDFYKNIFGEDDPIIQKSLQEAAAGGDENISNLGVIQAMQVYYGKYEKAFNSIKLSDLVTYLSDGYKIPEQAKKALGKYKENSLEELTTKAKSEGISDEEKQDIAKTVQAISILKNRKLKEKTVYIFNDITSQTLEALYAKEEKNG
jgi:hypothetical protein